MNKYIFLVFLYVNTVNSFAQIKILFDATKAETANNADWIIDADQHNLGYDPNPYIGGRESYAQRFPTPDQSGITASTSQDYWEGGISAWGVDAVRLGYIVETLPYTAQITYANVNNNQDLSNYDVFVVCEPNILFTADEKAAMINFVQNGGGLFMISDHDNSDRNGDGVDSVEIWNEFMQDNPVQIDPFGISFDYDSFNADTSNMANLPADPLLHGSYGDVTNVEFYSGTSMTLNINSNSSIKGVVYNSGSSNTGNTGVLCAYATYGNGKIVALGDSSPVDDGTGDPHDRLYDGWIEDADGNHERLIMNATVWLASHDSNVVNQSEIASKYQVNFSLNQVNIQGEGIESLKLIVSNLLGQEMLVKNLRLGKFEEIHLQADNLYIYQLIKDDGLLKTGKFVLDSAR